MKKNIGRLRCYSTLILLVAAINSSYAQTPQVVPATPPNPNFTNAGLCSVINNAVYRESAGVIYYGVVWDEGINPLSFVISDGVNPVVTTALTGPAGATMTNPDIAMGGTTTASYAVISYTATIAGVSDIYIETYSITAGPTVNLICGPTNISASVTGTADNSHIDMLTKDVGGVANTNGFVVSWEDMDCTMVTAGQPGVRACATSIGQMVTNCATPTITYPATANNCVNVNIDATEQDVAVVEKTINNVLHTIAIFAYLDPATSTLYGNAWDIVGGVGPEVQLDANVDDAPRIDAIDPHTITTGPKFDVTYRQQVGGIWHVFSYTNPLTVDITQPLTSTNNNNNFSPAIAAGPGNDYSIAYWNQNDNSAYVQRIDWSTAGLEVTMPFPPPGYYDYFQTNYGADMIDGPIAISNNWKSGSVVLPDQIFVCWYNTTIGEIDCKFSTSPPAFKPADVMTMKKADKAYIFPNPATDNIWISVGKHDMKGAKYDISDITGHTYIGGIIKTETQQVNISALPAGLYFVSIEYADKNTENTKFVKE